ncbi:MAG: hypothetical protein GX947_07690, partial [Tissierellia bacterium]|nr:hypothetical protein [Tissierellia bacterium]
MNKNLFKKVISLVIVFMMIMPNMPMSAYSNETTLIEDEAIQTQEQPFENETQPAPVNDTTTSSAIEGEPVEEEPKEEKPEEEEQVQEELIEEELLAQEELPIEEPTIISFESEGVTVEVSAEPGVLPEGTQIRLGSLSDDEMDMYLDAIQSEEDILIGYASLFDITLLDAEGNQIQPAGEVTVSFYGLDHIKEDDDVFVYHVEPE